MTTSEKSLVVLYKIMKTVHTPTYTHTQTCTQIFMVALFKTVKT